MTTFFAIGSTAEIDEEKEDSKSDDDTIDSFGIPAEGDFLPDLQQCFHQPLPNFINRVEVTEVGQVPLIHRVKKGFFLAVEGGKPAKLFDYPYVALVGFVTEGSNGAVKYNCGATLINRR